MPLQTKDLNIDAARQGVTGHGVRFVLGYGLGFAILAMIAVSLLAR